MPGICLFFLFHPSVLIYKSKTFKYPITNFDIISKISSISMIININNMAPKFAGKAKLTKQGQLTLPFEARQNLDIRADSELYWYEMDNYLIVLKELLNPKDVMPYIKKKRKG